MALFGNNNDRVALFCFSSAMSALNTSCLAGFVWRLWRCRLALPALAMTTLLPIGRATAQDGTVSPSSGVWLEGSALLGAAVLDANAARPWTNVGDTGPGLGLGGAVGFDGARLGIGAGFDVASTRIGDRRGSSLTVSALLRWAIRRDARSVWQPRIGAGYVRYGFGGALVAPAELPPNVFRSGANLPAGSADARLRVVGNGIRVELSGDRGWSPRSWLVMSAGADVVHFTSATYQHYDESLSNPGWGFLPRVALGIRVRPGI